MLWLVEINWLIVTFSIGDESYVDIDETRQRLLYRICHSKKIDGVIGAKHKIVIMDLLHEPDQLAWLGMNEGNEKPRIYVWIETRMTGFRNRKVVLIL